MTPLTNPQAGEAYMVTDSTLCTIKQQAFHTIKVSLPACHWAEQGKSDLMSRLILDSWIRSPFLRSSLSHWRQIRRNVLVSGFCFELRMLFVLDVFIAHNKHPHWIWPFRGCHKSKTTLGISDLFWEHSSTTSHQELLSSQIPHLCPIKRPVWGDPSAFSHSDLYPPFHLSDPNAPGLFCSTNERCLLHRCMD